MPIEVGIWRIGPTLEPVAYSRLDSEKRLESLLAGDLSIVDPDLMLIGRQVPTAFGKFIDLLAIDSAGRLNVLELKRDRTPRDVIAQLLDYGSWVRTLDRDALDEIYAASAKLRVPSESSGDFEQDFLRRFNLDELPDDFNESHKLVLVASELDDSSERIITYLADEYGVSINAVFFRVFRDGESEFLSRAWLSSPAEVEEKAESKRERLPWNGEFYASFGVNDRRDWDEARKYGFISAGGGAWYSRTLEQLEPGARIWVNIPGGVGYVGVGEVVASPVPVDEFLVEDDKGTPVPILSLPLKAARHATAVEDPDKAEHFVRVRWIKSVPADEAIREKGLFGNQNSVARPRSRKWVHTVERLSQAFGVNL